MAIISLKNFSDLVNKVNILQANITDFLTRLLIQEVYSTSEVVIGKWIDGKPLYRKTIACGALPNTAGKLTAHGISNVKYAVYVNGFATNGTASIPLPQANALDVHNMSLTMDRSNINIVTGADYSSWTLSYITVEYLKTTD